MTCVKISTVQENSQLAIIYEHPQSPKSPSAPIPFELFQSAYVSLDHDTLNELSHSTYLKSIDIFRLFHHKAHVWRTRTPDECPCEPQEPARIMTLTTRTDVGLIT